MSRQTGFRIGASFIGVGISIEHLAECPDRMNRYILATRQPDGHTRVADGLHKRALQVRTLIAEALAQFVSVVPFSPNRQRRIGEYTCCRRYTGKSIPFPS